MNDTKPWNWGRWLGVALAGALCATAARAADQILPAADAESAALLNAAPVSDTPLPVAGGTVKPAGLSRHADLKEMRQQQTVITSERIDFDYQEMVAVFDENVRVENPRFLMLADRMLVFLDGTNDVKQILAIGRVSVTNELRSAACDKAVYNRAAEQIVLTGNAHLRRGGDVIKGDRIAIWLHDERMEVSPGTFVISPGTITDRPATNNEEPH